MKAAINNSQALQKQNFVVEPVVSMTGYDSVCPCTADPHPHPHWIVIPHEHRSGGDEGTVTFLSVGNRNDRGRTMCCACAVSVLCKK